VGNHRIRSPLLLRFFNCVCLSIAKQFNSVHSKFKVLLASSLPAEIFGDIAKELLNTSRTLVLINADHYTAWNCRKRLVLQGVSSEEQEISMCNLVFTKYPKSLSTWAHKKWVLGRMQAKFLAGGSEVAKALNWDRLCQEELKHCSHVVQQYPRCYSCWTHRHWICANSISPPGMALSGDLN
jgi:hypothetical protein